MHVTSSVSTNILIRLSSPADEKLVKELLSTDYTILSDSRGLPDDSIDLLVIDFSVLEKLYDDILVQKKRIGIAYLPVMVMIPKGRMGTEKMWDIADDVVEMPVSKRNLQTRVNGLIKIRQYSKQVELKQKKLEKKNQQLRIYFNAIDATTTGVTIADPSQKDTPIIFSNRAFTNLTGYPQSEVIGQNCRFLQGDDRDQQARSVINDAIENGESCNVLIRNYRKDGTLFWNELKISPIKNRRNEVEYFVGIQNDVTRLVETQEALKSAKEQWESIVSQSPNLIQIAVNGVIRFVNMAGANIQGFDHPTEAIGKTLVELHPESQQQIIKDRIEQLNRGEATSPKIYSMNDNTGTTRYIKVQSIPITYEGQKAAQTVGVDVTQLKNTEIELKSLLNQKQVLLQEVHHRVKNNFAIISGLIELQLSGIENEDSASYLRDTQLRIISIAKVHELLYKQDNLHEIEFDQYFKLLAEKIKETIVLKEQKLVFNLDMDSLLLSLNQAIPCGLLLNELITNTVKHGYDIGETIKIDVKAGVDNEKVKIHYWDYGKGFSGDTDFLESGNFGATIIKILIQQLGADWEVKNENGMQFSFSFTKAGYHGPYKEYI